MINFDVVLENLGGFGAGQISIFFLLSYGNLIGGFNSLATVFIAYNPDSRYCQFLLILSLYLCEYRLVFNKEQNTIAIQHERVDSNKSA